MRKAEIARKFDAIVDFAETGQFIDTPVKHYSIGMYMRLAFAVAANLEPEILIIDEVLAVGDAAFQKKCLGKMSDVAHDGRTVLFVSHNLEAIQRLCNRCLFFEHGKLLADGNTASVIAQYMAHRSSMTRPNELIDLREQGRIGTGEARFVAAQYSSMNGAVGFQPYTGGPLDVILDIESNAPRTVRSVAVLILDSAGVKLVNADTLLLDRQVRLMEGRNRIRVSLKALHLNPGQYRIGLRLANPLTNRERSGTYDHLMSAFEIEVVDLEDRHTHFTSDAYIPCDFVVETTSL
jgi:lipopolysaccharide transport system ATP-binding protein